MAEFIFLKNRSERTQNAMYNGSRIELKGRESEAFPPEVAQIFLKQCPGIVIEESQNIGVRAVPEKAETLFLANWTGNPDASPTVDQVVYNKMLKIREVKQVANPFFEAKRIFRTVGGTQSQAFTPGTGVEFTLNHPARNIEFPPYQFKELPIRQAEQILSQEALAPGWMSGMIREIPAPQPFQPGMDWELDRMRAYLTYMDPSAKVMRMRKAKGEDPEIALIKAKRAMMQRLFFRLYDRNFRRPTSEEFEQYLVDVARNESREEREEREGKEIVQAAREEAASAAA